MKKVMLAKAVFLSVLCLMLWAPLALAGPITGTLEIDRVTGYYEPYSVAKWPGGEFNIYLKDGYPKPLYYSPAALATNWNGNIGFESFCLERGESVSIPGTYNYSISTKAIEGGVGPAGDPISAGTAYLYSQFAKGVLLNYNYADTAGSGRADSAKLLQQAIWYLEDEAGGVKNDYVDLAINQLGTETQAKADNNGQYAVMVLNITKANGTLQQDQLIYTPEPASLLLLGIGILGAALLRRKHKTT